MYDNFDDTKTSYNDYFDSELPYNQIPIAPSVEDAELAYGITSVFPEIKDEYCQKLRDPNFVNFEHFDTFVYFLDGLEHPEEQEIDFMVDMLVSEIENHIISKEDAQEIAENLFEFAKYGGTFYEKFLKETNQEISEFDKWRIDLKKRENELLRGEVRDDKVKSELFDSLVFTNAKIPADTFRALTGVQDTSIFMNDFEISYFIKHNDNFILCLHNDKLTQQCEVNPNNLELFDIASAAKIVLKQHNEHLAQIDSKIPSIATDIMKSRLVAKSYERVADKYSGPTRFLERTYIPDNGKGDPPEPSVQTIPVLHSQDSKELTHEAELQNDDRIFTSQEIAEQNILYENQLPLIEVEIDGIKTFMSQNEYDVFVDPVGNASTSPASLEQLNKMSDILLDENSTFDLRDEHTSPDVALEETKFDLKNQENEYCL